MTVETMPAFVRPRQTTAVHRRDGGMAQRTCMKPAASQASSIARMSS